MDRRQIEFQIRAVLVPFRVEERRRDLVTMERFRARALSILDQLEEPARPYPDLVEMLARARTEIAERS